MQVTSFSTSEYTVQLALFYAQIYVGKGPGLGEGHFAALD